MKHINNRFFLLLLSLMLTGFANAKTLGIADTFEAAKLTQKEISQLVPSLEKLAYDIPD